MTVLHSTGGLFFKKRQVREMNYGGEAADQIVRYSLDGVDHTLRISGSIAKNLAILIVAVLRDQKKTRGKTNLIRMLKEQKPTKFFSVPHDKLKEFAKEAKARGLLYVVIHDTKHPELSEIMVYADDAAKVNRVLDQLNLDYVSAEVGEAVVEQAPEKEGANQRKADGKSQTEKGKDQTEVRTEKVVLPEGTIEFELDENEHLFDVGEPSFDDGNFTQAQGKGNPSEPSLRSSGSTSGRETSWQEKKPSVRQELKQIQKDQNQRHKKQEPRKRPRNRNRNKTKKMKTKGR